MGIIRRLTRYILTALGIGSSRAVFKDYEQTQITIEGVGSQSLTPVDSYWSEHLVCSQRFTSAKKSLQYLEWRFEQYPLFRELMNLYGNHDDEVVLDYGCGPGNDLVGFAVYTGAKKVIGIDISPEALELAAERLALHSIDPGRIQLIQTSDSSSSIPLGDSSVDFIYCEGVLHHTSQPQSIMRELYRILKPDSQASIMVYNRNSIWFHFYTAYDKIILQNAFAGLSLDQAFSKNTDGEECPIARCYAPEEFIAICQHVGFQCQYAGGYLSLHEISLLKELGQKAISDMRLPSEHRAFLRSLEYDHNGYPKYEGKHAGIGGVFWLKKCI
jgi:ubiquinone/menaquinone biosynthesis C-methylase UbiE